MKPALLLRCLVSTVALAVPLHAALAQDKAKPVSRDELRACMNSESDLALRSRALEERKKAEAAEVAAIRAESQELAKEQELIDPNSRQVDRFRRKVSAHNARIQAANETQAAFGKDLAALNDALGAYNGKCGGIAFLDEDKQAILKEREAAKK